MKIPFNRPFITGRETEYILDAVENGKISGNGKYTQLCHDLLKRDYGFNKCLLTSSCTDALEMSAILMNIEIGDEVIMPSYTFVSTANAFVLRGAVIRFVDSRPDHPGMDESKIEELVNEKTKAIVVVHYAGVACDMDKVLAIANKYNLLVCEDAAQAIDATYKGKPLGSFGHMSAFSFHETKNISSGEGGMLVVNKEDLVGRSEIIWEKGTNRSAFFRGEVDKYNWVDIGSSYLPSDIIAAFLFAQLENLKKIQNKRVEIWTRYDEGLSELMNMGVIKGPSIPAYASNNGHMYYLVCRNTSERVSLIEMLKNNGVNAVFHYISLHKSPFYASRHDGRELQNCDHFSDCLVRLPFFYDLTIDDQAHVIESIKLWAQSIPSAAQI